MAAKKKKSGWGGVRKGQGRPKGEGWITRAMVFRPKVADAMDREAEADGLSRSQWVNLCVAKELKRRGVSID